MTVKGIINECYKPLTIFAIEDISSQKSEQTNFPEIPHRLQDTS